jgi:hypothetical protein
LRLTRNWLEENIEELYKSRDKKKYQNISVAKFAWILE